MATGPLVMRIMALSIKVVGTAGSIIRDVMTKGNLGVVDKVTNCRVGGKSSFKL